MNRFYITVIVLLLGLIVVIVDTEEDKINKLEQTVSEMSMEERVSQDMIDDQMVRIDELSGANEALVGLTPCHVK
jgi:hypothetical protein